MTYSLVARDPETAYSLFDEKTVEYENLRLEQHEGEYKGNFTFSVSASPFVAVVIIGGNIRVAVTVFALGGSEGSVHLINAADGKLVRSLPGHTSSVSALAFHPNGTLLGSV